MLAATRSAGLNLGARGRSRLSRVLEALVSAAEEASFLLTSPPVSVTLYLLFARSFVNNSTGWCLTDPLQVTRAQSTTTTVLSGHTYGVILRR